MARASRPLSRIFGDKPLEHISDAEIRELVSKHVAKRQYKSPDAVPKLLRHVVSFANGGGGYLILGIRDDGQGRAQKFEGIQGNVESSPPSRGSDLCACSISTLVSATSRSSAAWLTTTRSCLSGSREARGSRT